MLTSKVISGDEMGRAIRSVNDMLTSGFTAGRNNLNDQAEASGTKDILLLMCIALELHSTTRAVLLLVKPKCHLSQGIKNIYFVLISEPISEFIVNELKGRKILDKQILCHTKYITAPRNQLDLKLFLILTNFETRVLIKMLL